MRKSFVFNCEWQEVLMEYPAEVRLEVYDAIIEYVASGRLSELKPLAKMAFSFIRKEIDSNNAKYDQTVKKRSEAGKKGMASRYGSGETADGAPGDNGTQGSSGETTPNLTKPNKPNKPQQTQQSLTSLTNLTDNVYDGDNVYVSTDVDGDMRAPAREPPSPPPTENSLDKEIERLKADEQWLDQMQALRSMDVAALKALLDGFRLHCAATGLERGHPGGMRDAKQHFNSWLRKRNGAEAQADGERLRQAASDAQAADERRKAEERREKDRFTPPPGFNSLTWYREVKRRAEAGDAQAQEMLRGKETRPTPADTTTPAARQQKTTKSHGQ